MHQPTFQFFFNNVLDTKRQKKHMGCGTISKKHLFEEKKFPLTGIGSTLNILLSEL